MENVVNDPVSTSAKAVQPEASVDLAVSTATPTKKAVAKKAVAKKAVAKKAVAKKAVAKKAVAKKVTAKKAVAKKATVKKSVAKKVITKQPRDANTRNVAPIVANPEQKAKKVKLVRDSFTMPGHEYQVLQDIKKAALKAGIELKKSDLLRIGVGMLKNFSVTQLDKARSALTKLRAGRPKK